MATEPDRLVVDGQLIREGTSLYLTRTCEVAWITEIGDDYIHMETVTSSFRLRESLFAKRISDEGFVVESQPSGQREFR